MAMTGFVIDQLQQYKAHPAMVKNPISPWTVDASGLGFAAVPATHGFFVIGIAYVALKISGVSHDSILSFIWI
jgi:hypothetical protein